MVHFNVPKGTPFSVYVFIFTNLFDVLLSVAKPHKVRDIVATSSPLCTSDRQSDQNGRLRN